MSLQTYKVKVAEHTILASKFQYVHLELIAPPRLEFTAGQYVMMKVPTFAEATAGEPGFRLKQYSIASVPSMNHAVEILVDISPAGPGSTYLKNLRPGDTVEFMAPAGRFVIEGNANEKELIFVATGSGISTVKSMIEDLLIDKQDQRSMWLHWGLRYAEDVFWFDDLARLAEEHQNFSFDLVLSKPPADWELCRGRVTECVVKHHNDFATMGAYLCGNKQMIADVHKILVDKGVRQEQIHHEQYY